MPPTIVHFKRRDDSRGTAVLEECTPWPATRYEFDTPECVDGKMIPRAFAMEDLDWKQPIAPSIFRTPSGEYFRRLNWHEIPGAGLKRERNLYVGLTRDEARELLQFYRHDLPPDLVETLPADEPKAETAGKTARMPKEEAVRRLTEGITLAEHAGRWDLTKNTLASRVGVPRSSALRYLEDDEGLKRAWQGFTLMAQYDR